MKASMKATSDIERLKGRVEMLDYILNMFCDREVTADVKLRLKVMKYSYQSDIDEFRNRNIIQSN